MSVLFGVIGKCGAFF